MGMQEAFVVVDKPEIFNMLVTKVQLLGKEFYQNYLKFKYIKTGHFREDYKGTTPELKELFKAGTDILLAYGQRHYLNEECFLGFSPEDTEVCNKIYNNSERTLNYLPEDYKNIILSEQFAKHVKIIYVESVDCWDGIWAADSKQYPVYVSFADFNWHMMGIPKIAAETVAAYNDTRTLPKIFTSNTDFNDEHSYLLQNANEIISKLMKDPDLEKTLGVQTGAQGQKIIDKDIINIYINLQGERSVISEPNNDTIVIDCSKPVQITDEMRKQVSNDVEVIYKNATMNDIDRLNKELGI